MKAVVSDVHWDYTAIYFNHTDSNGICVKEVIVLEINLLRIVLQQMNVTFVHVPIPKGFELKIGSEKNLTIAVMATESYIALGDVGIQFFINTRLDSTNTHMTARLRWYVPCSFKYPRWSSVFRILSQEFWLALIISIVIAAI